MIELSILSGSCLIILLDVSIKSLALAAFAALCLEGFRVQNPSLRHAAWVSVLCGMLSMPFLSLALPGVLLPLVPLAVAPPPRGAGAGPPPAESSTANAARSTAVPRDPVNPGEAGLSPELSSRPKAASADQSVPRVTWRVVAFGGYMAGVIVIFARCLLGLAGCRRLACASHAIVVDRLAENVSPTLGRSFQGRGVEVSECPTIHVSVTMGWFRPRILLPVDWSCWQTTKLEAVLAHELAHVERRDTLFAMLGAINQCLYWFHPVAWLVPKRLAALSEHACDDRAIALTGAPNSYARHLLEFAAIIVDHRQRPNLGALSIADGGDLRSRINAILDGSRVICPPLSRRAALLTTAMALLIVPALAVLRVGPRALGGAAQTEEVLFEYLAEKTSPGREPESQVTYAGRVVGPDGRPIAGARLFLTKMRGYYREPFPAAQLATTGLDGRFRFTVPMAGIRHEKSVVAGLAADYGVGWLEVPADGQKDDLTLRLENDDLPITGQVVDLEGRPVAGATLRVLEIEAGTGKVPGPGLKKKRSMRDAINLSSLALQATTNTEGRLRLTGIGPHRIVEARLDGPTIASHYLQILTWLGRSLVPPSPKSYTFLPTYFGVGFRAVAEPTRPVVGVVRDKDTGKPLEGVTIESNQLANSRVPGNNIVHTTTDANGRYRLNGLPNGKGNNIRLVPRDDLPYLSVHALVPDSPGLEPVTVDFELRRGVWIEGRLTDKVTGKPVQGSVDYFALATNPNVRDHLGFNGTIAPRWGTETNEDGSFRTVGLPGPGLIAVFYTGEHLLVPEREDEYGSKEAFIDSSPRQLGRLLNYTALARINPLEGAESVRRDITLDPGWTFTCKVQGPDGKPLVGARAFGLSDRERYHEPMKTSVFTVRAFNPRRPRDVFFQHPEKGLVGIARPPRENGGSINVPIEPGATITGWLIDAVGKPRAGVRLEVWFRHKGDTLYGDWSEYSPGPIETERGGRFRVLALLPGYEVRFQGDEGELPLGVAPGSGQTKDLGNVQLKRKRE